MPSVQHSSLSLTELHEPKGISAASDGDVYVADGAGSGDWQAAIAYGNIYSSSSDSVTISTIGTTAKKFEGFAQDGEASGMTIDASSDTITVVTSGVYKVDFKTSFATVANADSGLYEFVLRVDGVATHVESSRNLSGTDDTGSLSMSGLVSLSAGEDVTIYVASDNGSDADDISVVSSSLTLRLLKEV